MIRNFSFYIYIQLLFPNYTFNQVVCGLFSLWWFSFILLMSIGKNTVLKRVKYDGLKLMNTIITESRRNIDKTTVYSRQKKRARS